MLDLIVDFKINRIRFIFKVFFLLVAIYKNLVSEFYTMQIKNFALNSLFISFGKMFMLPDQVNILLDCKSNSIRIWKNNVAWSLLMSSHPIKEVCVVLFIVCCYKITAVNQKDCFCGWLGKVLYSTSSKYGLIDGLLLFFLL